MSASDVWGPGPRAGLYLVAFLLYVGLGLLTRSVVLNWIVGPLFPLFALYVVPRVVTGARGR